MKTVRCAIYTRKSSDEGLEQSFNSLDAQREACSAYILSQASEGWTALPDIYDDGGLSGGTLERPALQRLLAEVAARRVDIIVVYKVDRLTRSLFDFAKLVETFDAAGTSFVSVTQSFNTTTSMGRLTLNMLLSFAQFEREVTAERIRDKIAASKARGMWMGGTPPLGYAPDGRSLAIVEEHAALVRHLFVRYLALGGVRQLEEELARYKIRVPQRTRVSGKPIGGGAFTRGQLYHILQSVVYIGKVGHKGKVHDGLHPAIIDADTFAAAQAMFADNVQGTRTRANAAEASLLAGKVVDEAGEPLLASHTSKAVRHGTGKVRHRYYVSCALHEARSAAGLRIPARELETLVRERLRQFLADPLAVATSARLEITPGQITSLHDRCRELSAKLGERRPTLIVDAVTQVRVAATQVAIVCDIAALAALLGMNPSTQASEAITLTCMARLTRSGRALRLIQDSGALLASTPDPSLVRLIVQARRWWAILRGGEIDIRELARREGVTPSYATRVVRAAFLSPAVVEAILSGRQRAGVSAANLTASDGVASDWREQAAALLPDTSR